MKTKNNIVVEMEWTIVSEVSRGISNRIKFRNHAENTRGQFTRLNSSVEDQCRFFTDAGEKFSVHP